MHALKEKVSDRLSRFFADPQNSSPSSSSSPLSSPRIQPDDQKARPSSKGGKSSSSYFSFGIPSINLGGYVSKKNRRDLKPTQSLTVRLDEDFEQQDEFPPTPYHECIKISENEEFQKYNDYDERFGVACEKKLTVKTQFGDDDSTPGSNGIDSDVFEEAREQQTPSKPFQDLMDESAFITSDLYEFLSSSIPNIVKGCQWVLMYSTLKHGISLRTLIHRSAELSGPCLLIAGDRQGAVFGGMLECPLKPTAMRKYQGTNQCFVFTTIYGDPRLFRPTGANRYYYMCLHDILALGGGGNFALRLDGDLLNGTSGPCDTFGNMCLAHTSEFELKNVELWGFRHASKYITS